MSGVTSRQHDRQCPRPEELAAFLAGELPQPALDAIAWHVSRCNQCGGTVALANAAAEPPRRRASDRMDLSTRSFDPASEDSDSLLERAAATRDLVVTGFSGTDRFQVENCLGAGGMGVVYQAYDQLRGERVALKTIRRLDATSIFQFKQEFRALADVAHPNLVVLHELFCTGQQWFFTMELVKGANFVAHVCGSQDSHELNGFDPVRLRAALQQLAEGISALHQAGKLHRDIKPSNVLVTRQGRVVLLDFGLATEWMWQRSADSSQRHFVGTVAYMSPEQGRCLPLSPASDWYSLGVVLYRVLTGRIPFSGPPPDVLLAKQERQPPAPALLVDGIPEDLNSLCMALLAPSPEDRPTGPEVLRRLQNVVTERPVLAIPSSAPHSAPSFIGRERHLAALQDAFATVKRGSAVTVFVDGRSGFGKSVLVQHFLDSLADQAVILVGRCYERESVPYKALDSLMDALTRFLRHLPRWETEVLLPRDTAALARVFPVLRSVEAVLHAPARSAETPDQQELRRRAFSALRELLARLGDRRPLVLFIDDLQWGDADSAALLADLLSPPDPPVLLLLGCYRSEDAAASECLQILLQAESGGGLRGERRVLDVGVLTRSEARELAQRLLAQADPEAQTQADAVADESRGNPYFVHELVRHVQAGEALARRPASSATLDLDQVLWERIEYLPPPARRLLDIAAVAGQPVKQATACLAAELVGGDMAALHLLRAGHLLRSTGPGQQDEIETFHDAIRATVTAHLSAAELQDCHRRLAVALVADVQTDPEFLAVQFQAAGERNQAGHYYALAAARASQTLAFHRAAELYQLALQLGTTDAVVQRALRTNLAHALANAGQGAKAAREYQAAGAAAKGDEALELQRHAAYQFCVSGHIREGRAVFEEVLRRVGMKLPSSPRHALVSLMLGRALLWLRGIRFRERDAASIPVHEVARIDVSWAVSIGLTMIDTIGAADFQARNLSLALRAGEPSRLARALAWQAAHMATDGVGSQQRVAKVLEAAQTLSARVDHPHVRALCTLASGIATYFRGHWNEALRLSDEAERMFRDHCTGVAWEVATAQSFSLWSLYFLGEVAELARRLSLHLQQARERGDLLAEASLANLGGTLAYLAGDDPEGARDSLVRAMGPYADQRFHTQHFTSLAGHLQIDVYTGDGRAAWQRVRSQWPALKGSMLLHIEAIRIFMVHLRARCALAAAHEAEDASSLLACAEADARRLRREKAPWSRPLAELIRAALAARRGEKATALRLLASAAERFEAADMRLFAAAARRRQGHLLADESGQQLIQQADQWMAQQRIQNPERMTELYAPGFPILAPAPDPAALVR